MSNIKNKETFSYKERIKKTEGSGMGIQQLFSNYIKKRGLRKKSISTYECKINNFCEFLAKAKIYRLERISTNVIDLFFDSLSERSATTHNAYKETLNTFFRDFKKDGLIKKNPVESVRKKPETRQGRMFFSDTHVAQLAPLIKEKSPELWMGCQLLYYCFIRNTEIASLPLEDVFIGEGVIRLSALYSKNKKNQTVVIPDEFLPEIKEWYAKQKERGATHFITPRGKPARRGDWFTKKHKQVMRKLGYSQRFSFYSWKHTGTVHFYKATKDLKALQLQLRHHSLDQVDEYMRELGVMENVGIKVHSMPITPKSVTNE